MLLNPYRFGSAPPPPGGYFGEVMADSPIIYWRLDETSGTVMGDVSGNGNNGVYRATDVASESVAGLLTDDSNKAVAIPSGLPGYAHGMKRDVCPFNTDTSWTFTGLVKPATEGTVLQIGDPFGGSSMPELGVVDGDGPGQFKFRVLRSGVALLFITGNYNYGDAHHFGLRAIAGGGIALLVDGIGVGTSAAAFSSSNTGEIRIASALHAGSYQTQLAGTFDELAFFTAALSDARIAAQAAAV